MRATHDLRGMTSMYPLLISVGELRFHSYTVMMTLAFLVGAIGPAWLNSRLPKPYPASPAGAIWIFVGAIAGSKIYWMAQYGGWEDLRYFQFFLTGGLVFFGGLIGIIAGIGYLRLVNTPILPVADMVAPFLALAHGIGRVGCFLNGCCWGALTKWNIPWAVRYPKASYGVYRDQISKKLIGIGDETTLPVHPVQLYETLGLVIIFFILLHVYRRHKRHGEVAFCYLALYGILRFITEIFRGESARPVLGMTVSQTVGLGLLVAGLLLLATLSVRPWAGLFPDMPEQSLEEKAEE